MGNSCTKFELLLFFSLLFCRSDRSLHGSVPKDRRTAMLWDGGVTKKILSGLSRTCNDTGLAPGVVIMKIDDCTARAS